MSTRNTIQHFWSPTEPNGASVGDEWYNSATNVLYKRISNSLGIVSWLELATLDSSGNKTLTNPTIKNYTEQLYFVTVINNAITLSLDNGSFQSITTMTGTNTITLPTPAAGKSIILQIAYAATGGSLVFAVTGSSVKWIGGIAPTATLVTGKFDFYSFISDGKNWYGSQSGANF